MVGGFVWVAAERRSSAVPRLNWVGVSFPTHRRFGFASRLYVVNRPLSCSVTGC